MGLKTLMQIPGGAPGGAPGGGPQQMPNRIDGYKPRADDYYFDEQKRLGIARPPSFNNTAVGPGHPDYQEGSVQKLLPRRQIQLPPGMEPPGIGMGFPGGPRPPNVGGDVGNIKRDDSADYSSQFSGFGDQLGGFGKQLTGFGDQLGGLGNQMTGYQDALGGFNEQVGGFGKQFENLNTRLDSMEKGIASLGEQFQPQQQQQQQNPYANFYSNSNPFGSSMYGGLGSMMRYF